MQKIAKRKCIMQMFVIYKVLILKQAKSIILKHFWKDLNMKQKRLKYRTLLLMI